MISAYVDGAFCRDTNLYGAGVYLNCGLNPEDEILAYGHCYTSVEAELFSAYHCLKELHARDYSGIVEITMDCLPMVEALTGDSPYTSVVLGEVLELLVHFEDVRFLYDSRKFNAAHSLSKEALRIARGKINEENIVSTTL